VAVMAPDPPHCSEAIFQRLSPSLTVYQFSDADEAGCCGAGAGGADTAAEAAMPAAVGIRYVCPTITLFGSCLSEGLAATTASRLVRVFDPMNLAAILETVSFSTATYFVSPPLAREMGFEELVEPTLTISSPCCLAASRRSMVTFGSPLEAPELFDAPFELLVALSGCEESLT